MLAELLLRLTTTAPPEIRRLGLVRESVWLWSRANRRRREWAAHEAHCHAIVDQAVARLPRHRTVAVLGSGLCRDIPIARLADMFGRVVLVDAVHLWPVRLRLARHRNIQFVIRDLTGLAKWILGDTDVRGDPLADLRADPDVDLVISANLLSQIAICPENWLDDHPARAGELPVDLPENAIRWHLDDISAFACPVCLLTDVHMTVVDHDGNQVEDMNLVADLPMPPPDDAWDWPVAPFGEIGRHVARIHRVHGYVQWRADAMARLPDAAQSCDHAPCPPPTSTP
jgi:hypothetical protein